MITGFMDPMISRFFRIVKRVQEAADVFTVELDFGDLISEPGQFNMLYVPAVGEAAISLSGPMSHTVRAVGSVTRAMQELPEGAQIGVRGPFGRPWPIQEALGKDLLLIAGGIGIAPLRPVIYEVIAKRGQFKRVGLLYGARTPQDILFNAELVSWRDQHGIQVEVTVDRASSGWSGNVGVVPGLISRVNFNPAEARAMICGPEIMMKFTVHELLARHVSLDRIFVALERNMKCGLGFCGHCQLGPKFVCKDGAVFSYSEVERWLGVREC